MAIRHTYREIVQISRYCDAHLYKISDFAKKVNKFFAPPK